MRDSFKYMLRFSCDPGFNDHLEIPSLLKYADAARIDDVAVFANVEEINTGYTLPHEQELFMNMMAEIKRLLEPKGITFSINSWHTVMHADFGKELEKEHDFRRMVDPEGNMAKLCVCPMDEKWQDYMAGLLARYAELKPYILWIEDDYRFHNHDPLIWGGCFCDAHMAVFSRKANKTLTREEFIKGLLKPGEVHPYREIWLDSCRETMNRLSEKIGKAIAAVSPETRVGLMSSAPHVHASEGRDWAGILYGLSQNNPPVNRTHLPCYVEYSPSAYMMNFNSVSMLTRALVPDETEIYPELENFPFSRFTKSLRFTRFQMLSAMPLRPSGITINLYDLNGNGIVWKEGYQDMLRGSKDFLNELTGSGVFDLLPGGVKVMADEKSSYTLHTEYGRSMEELNTKEMLFAALLPAFGIPFSYCLDREVRDSIVAISGQYLRNHTEEQISALFENNFVILNGDAAFTLFEMGLGHLANISSVRWVRQNSGEVAIEQVCNGREYCGIKTARASAMVMCSDVLAVEYSKPVYHLTEFRNSYRRVTCKGLTVSGGRCCIYPFGNFQSFPDMPRMLLNNVRQALLQEVIKEALKKYRNIPMIINDPYINPYYYITEKGFALYIVNAATDDYEKISVDTGNLEIGSIEAMDSSGSRKPEVSFRQEGTVMEMDLLLKSMETALLHFTITGKADVI